jgi:uncharacterized protein with FMN-binding domain
MNRAPIVLTGTALGLGAVLGYHTSTTSKTIATASSASTTATTTTSTTTTGSSASTSRTTSSATRSATGTDVDFQYGDIELKVTMSGSKITSVSVARLNVTDPRSQEIDQQAIPLLTQEVLSAQSANINAVSGASYTSQAYEQSLQSALDKLGVTSSASS